MYDNRKVSDLRREFPIGSIVEMIRMADDPNPVESGTKGTVQHIDDAGQIHVAWQGGRTLAILPDMDEYRVLSKAAPFRLTASLRFDRPIDRARDSISPGGYEMVMNGVLRHFDFEDFYGTIDDLEPSVLHYEHETPDYISFPDMSYIHAEDLGNVTKIEEFYVDTDTSDGSEPLSPVELVYARFETGGEFFELPENICKTAFREGGVNNA